MIINKTILVKPAVLLVILTGWCQARTFYVSPDASHTGAGTLNSPLSVKQACILAKPGDTVSMLEGIYRETITPVRSGTIGMPITFAAYKKHRVIISGCDQVAGWTRHKGDIWKATVTWDAGADGAGNTFFVNGDLKFEAREHAENDPLELDNWGKIAARRLKSDSFTADDIKGWGDDFWNGAKVRHHTHDWILRDSTIADYDSASGRITFEKPLGVISQKHVLGYYIFDTLKALNHAGEWFKDRETNTLYYQVESGQNPGNLDIEFKRWDYGFDLRGRDYIRIHGLTFRGISIRTDNETGNNLYDGNTLYAYDKAGFGRFYISGNHNVFRDNEVSQTWGGVVTVSGTGHQLVNNYFHDIGYGGTARVIGMSGSAHLVSYNTVRKFARSFLDGFPYRSEFAFNLFEDGANLSWDTGVFDGDAGRGNGGGCIVHHNVFRNTDSIGIYCAFYAGLELVVHHNIVYDLGPSTLRAGVPIFLKYYHNTWIGAAPKGNVNAADIAVESNYNNNLQVTTDNVSSLGVNHRGNYNYTASDFVDFDARDFRLAVGSGAIDAGIVLPGVNDRYSGDAPDAGALEYGQVMWRVGHDFSAPPTPVYSWEALPGTNMIKDGLFSQSPTDWTYTGTPVWFYGNAWNTVGTGLSRSGGHCFQLNPGDGIRRTFNGLKPNIWYTVSSETRLVDQCIEAEQFDGSQGSVTSATHRGEDYVTDLAEGEWLCYNDIDFGDSGKYDQLELSYTRPPGTKPGGALASLVVRIGSPAGKVLGEFQYNESVQDSWYTAQIKLPTVSGKQSLYLRPSGPGAAMMRLAALRLLNTHIPAQNKLTIGVRNTGDAEVSSQIGEAFWRMSYETFAFRTGLDSTSAELFIQNNGLYDAYLDRLALYQTDRFIQDERDLVESDGMVFQVSGLWQVSFAQIINVGQLTLQNVDNDNSQKLTNFKVLIWDRGPDDGGKLLWQKDYFPTGSVGKAETFVIRGDEIGEDGITRLGSVLCRTVRVQANGTPRFTLANAKIYSAVDVPPTDNIALSGDASQSSNLYVNAGLAGTANNSVVLPKGDFTSTRPESHAWWQVDLKQASIIDQIVIFNRIDAASRVGNFRVSVWHGDPEQGGTERWAKNYSYAAGDLPAGGSLTINGDVTSQGTRLDQVTDGRYVRVALLGNNILSLAEVQVWTRKSDVVRTDQPIIETGRRAEFLIEKRYLNIPLLLDSKAPKRNMTIKIDGEILGVFQVPLALDQGDYYGFIDLSKHQGKTLTVEVDRFPRDLGKITLDDKIKGAEDLYREKFRPQFHFTAKRGWLNDSNGLIYLQGQYHLYYQHNPFSVYWGNMSWGHAVSTDLVHWQEQSVVLFPKADTGACFSGAAFIDRKNQLGLKTGDDDVLVAFYLRTKIGLCFAYSNDRGQSMTDYEGNPVLTHVGARIDTPRPFWYELTKRWIAPTYDFFTNDEGKRLRCVGIYSSANLTDWIFESRVEQDKWGDELCGCVDFFQLPVDGDPGNKKWIMILIDGSYIVGNFDGHVFSSLAGKPAVTKDRVRSLVIQGNYYATMTWENMPDDRRVQVTWMKAGNYPGMSFSQQMTVPSELTLHSTEQGPRLRMNPIKELEALRTRTHTWNNLVLKAGENPLYGLKGDLFDLEVEFEPSVGSETVFDLRGVNVVYDAVTQTLTSNGKSTLLRPVEGLISLRILLDRTSIEVYANHGRVYIPHVVFPEQGNLSLVATCTKGEVQLRFLRIHELQSIW